MNENAGHKPPNPRLEGTNWLEQYFWPFGRTSSAQFGRGWLMVGIGQVLILIICTIMLFFKDVAMYGLIGALIAIIIGSWVIGVLHVRRFHDSGRIGLFSGFVYIPVLAGLLLMLAPDQPPQKPIVASAQTIASSSEESKVKTKESKPALESKNKKKFAKKRGKKGKSPLGVVGIRGAKLIGGFSIFAVIMTLFSLLVIHKMGAQSGANRWGKPRLE